jgi:RNA polymerase sigma factor for flagellar operon FliA
MEVEQEGCFPNAFLTGEFATAEACKQAIMSEMSMVKDLAQSIQHKLSPHVEINDLLSAGTIGLIDAASRYDASQGTTFSTFAYCRVRGAILDSLRMEVEQEDYCPDMSLTGRFATAEAREQAIMGEMPMVKALAQSIHDKLPRYVEISDLLSAGIIGLIGAAGRYDTSQGTTFSTFAYSRVRGAILDSLRDEDCGSRTLRRKAKQIEVACNRLSTLFGRDPSESEVASFLQISLDEYRSRAQAVWMATIQSIDEEACSPNCYGEVETDLLVNLIPDRSIQDPQSRLEQKEDISLIHHAIESLPDRQKTIITLYYYRGMTMSQIGSLIGVKESGVSKMHAKALQKLKASMLDTAKAECKYTDATLDSIGGRRKPITAICDMDAEVAGLCKSV